MKAVVELRKQLKRTKQSIIYIEGRIKELENQEKRVYQLGEAIRLYLSIDTPRGVRIKIPKKFKPFFYRIGIENGIPAVRLQEYAGAKVYSTPIASQERRKLIRQCITDPQIRDKWERFKAFIEDPNH